MNELEKFLKKKIDGFDANIFYKSEVKHFFEQQEARHQRELNQKLSTARGVLDEAYKQRKELLSLIENKIKGLEADLKQAKITKTFDWVYYIKKQLEFLLDLKEKLK